MTGKNAWQLQDSLLPDAVPDAKGDAMHAPQWDHPGDYLLKYPSGEVSKATPNHNSPHCRAYFDGGSMHRIGTAGYAAFRPDGTPWFAAGHLLPAAHSTNNEAELHALKYLLEEIDVRS